MKTKFASFFVTLLVACIELSQTARALTPPPDGGYPGGTTAEGQDALFMLTTGFYNTAVGFISLTTNTTGNFNTAIGAGALRANTKANENTAIGAGALYLSNSPLLNRGNRNTAAGAFALFNNLDGPRNTAIGDRALFNNVSGSGNIALGESAGSGVTTGNGVICIGADGDNTGNSCYIGQIFGATSSGGTAVFINSSGKLGTATSSRRFKEEIKPMERASEVLFALKPVTFHYKKEIDPQGIPQFGLVAEDVEAINPDLVVRDKEGKTNTVRYEAINAMLLNEFLKQHAKVEAQSRKIQEQEATIAELRKGMKTVVANIREQDAKIQRVSDQVGINSPAAVTVVSDQ